MTKIADGTRTIAADLSYWAESKRPLVSLAFIAPILVVYELGLLVLGPSAMRNGADAWLRQSLEAIGFTQYFLLPVLTCAILISWHHLCRYSWQVSWSVLYGMFVEAFALGFALLVIAHWQSSLLADVGAYMSLSSEGNLISRLVAYLGAGIYEELLFRLMLIPALFGLVRWAGASSRASCITAVIVGSILFAAAHYRLDVTIGAMHLATSGGELFSWTSFLFRIIAGVWFSVLFVYRGFGVTVGTHALYDILVAI